MSLGRLAAALALLAVAAGASTWRPALAAEERVEGARCVVVPHGVGRAATVAGRDAFERSLPTVDALVPWKAPAGERVVVHLYAKQESYARAMRDADCPELEDNWGATLYATNESHVVMQPRVDEEFRALVGGFPEYTTWCVVHEAVHQRLRQARAKNIDGWPDWYEEGLCEWTAERAIASLQAGGRTSIPADDRAHIVREALEHDRFFSLRELLHVVIQAHAPERHVYAHAWSFVRFLANDAKRFRALADAIEALPPATGTRSQKRVALETAFEEALVAVYGPLGPLEAVWREAVRFATPRWGEPVRSTQYDAEGRIVSVAFPGGNTILVAAAPPPVAGYRVSGRLRIVPGDERQADLVFAYERRDAPRYLKLALSANGTVTLYALAGEYWQHRYQKEAEVDAAMFAVGTEVPFSMTVSGGRVRLEVREETVFEAAVPPGFDAVRGAWGVGARDCGVVWSDLQVAPTP